MSTYHIYSLASHHALSPEVESGGFTGSCGLPPVDPGCCAFQGSHPTSRQLQPTIPVEMGCCSLDVTVYRKPTHTDRYLDFQSHHPSHVKRGLLRCLYDRARSITTRQDNLKKEECHLAKVMKQNGYHNAFIRSSSVPSRQNVEVTEAPLLEEGRRSPLVMLPYTEGVSEDIRRVCRKFGLKVIFRSGLSLRCMLTMVKDTLVMEKRSKVVYQIPCSCGKKYIGRQ